MSSKKNIYKKNVGRYSLSKANNKRTIFGFVLIIPFMIGFLAFFLQPLILSLIYSFNSVGFQGTGISLEKVGVTNYNFALFIDAKFRDSLMSSMKDLLLMVPLVVLFSLLIGVLLNKKTVGANMARVVLFLPVIITTGVLLYLESSDYLMGTASSMLSSGVDAGIKNNVYNTTFFDLKGLLTRLRLPSSVLNYINIITNQFYAIVISSGVQITLMIAGLQSIPPSLYEASSIEGATAWENFWKITFPMASPYLFVNTLYTIINTFTNPTNEVVQYIRYVAFNSLNYGGSSAMAWIYFILIGLVIGISAWLFLGTGFVVYQDK